MKTDVVAQVEHLEIQPFGNVENVDDLQTFHFAISVSETGFDEKNIPRPQRILSLLGHVQSHAGTHQNQFEKIVFVNDFIPRRISPGDDADSGAVLGEMHPFGQPHFHVFPEVRMGVSVFFRRIFRHNDAKIPQIVAFVKVSSKKTAIINSKESEK